MSSKHRSDGEGSIFQRKDGKWVAAISTGNDHTGKRQRRTRITKTRKEATKKLQELRAEAAQGPKLTNENITLTDWCHYWCEEFSPLTASPATVTDYRWTLDRYVLPYIGKHRVRDLTPLHCASFQKSLLSKNYATETVRHARRPLSAALRHAELEGLILVSPLRAVPQPKKKPGIAKIKSLTREQAQTLLTVAAESDPVLHAVVALTLSRGLRRGEALGLLKSHLDFDNEVIHIQQRIREERLLTRDGEYVIELLTAPPKTFKSRRDLTLSGEVKKALRRVLHQQKKDRLAAGEAWHESDHVFTTRLGKPLYPSNVSKRLKRLLKENGLPDVGAHALRHTWTVLSMEAGVRVEEAQEALGHESIETTKNIYAHSVKGLAKRAFDTFDESMIVKTRLTGLPHTAHNHER